MLNTAESITPSHPDKVCDVISDSILDECLKQDPDSRVAVEVLGGHGIVTVSGELTTKAFVDVHEIVQNVVGNKYGVQVNIVKQSPQIAQGVDKGGAGDQGIMIGYATRENAEMIPQELYLARSLCKFLYRRFPEDGKTQITLNENNEIKAIVASFCNVPSEQLGLAVRDWLGVKPRSKDMEMHVNPAGDWTQGGFEADTGLTGRKLACDNYGPQIPIGGGAASGKDSSKVDRSAAYKARQLAVRLLRDHPEAQQAIVKLAYAIGVARPVMASGMLLITETDRWEEIELPITDELTPKGIIDSLNLKTPIYSKVAEWGAYGNGFAWDNP